MAGLRAEVTAWFARDDPTRQGALANLIILSLTYVTCFGLFFYGAWIVAVAPALALLLSALGIITYQYLHH